MASAIHNILIALHALGGIVCFITGCMVLVPPVRQHAGRRWLFNLFLGSLALMLVPLFLVIAVDWPQLDAARRVIFTALGALGLYMAWRAVQAHRALQAQPEGWRLKYIDHVGFNLISLFDGFVIVAAIDLGTPGWLVGVIALFGIAGGIWGVNIAKSKAL
ncbi:MAG TPA: hypothetical protein VLB04_06135 [Methanotrichaceae archaeon]|nr:hypothetical protein [Methanotrichaceae archaeon]